MHTTRSGINDTIQMFTGTFFQWFEVVFNGNFVPNRTFSFLQPRFFKEFGTIVMTSLCMYILVHQVCYQLTQWQNEIEAFAYTAKTCASSAYGSV